MGWKDKFPNNTDSGLQLPVRDEAEATKDRLFAACVRWQAQGSRRQEVLDAMHRCTDPTSKDMNAMCEFTLAHRPKSKGCGHDIILEVAKWMALREVPKHFAVHWQAVRDVVDAALAVACWSVA